MNSALPKIVLIYQVQSQVSGARTFYYGEEVSKTLPTFVHPAEFFDGAVVSGNYKIERKIPTSLHCSNPYILEMLERHGQSLDFLGVILSRVEPSTPIVAADGPGSDAPSRCRPALPKR